tara:strand:- start:5240 stop:5731 length:492 start_codon:yes stop_codon:yes gene_type:complete
MKLNLLRINSSNDSTNGLLYNTTDYPCKFMCYTLEDEPREKKVRGETCIPYGLYYLGLKTHGRLHETYKHRFADIHVGMIEILNVPNFTDILIHCGNTNEDTSGCLLVGDTQENNNTKESGFIGKSTIAYYRIYKTISEALLLGYTCSLVISEEVIGKNVKIP